jgi:transcriptional regulator with XRE-family HTH domain
MPQREDNVWNVTLHDWIDPEETKRRLGTNLRALIKLHGVDQGDVAAALGLNIGTVGSICRGRHIPRDSTFKALAKLFDVSVEAFIGDTDTALRSATAVRETAPLRGSLLTGQPVLTPTQHKLSHHARRRLGQTRR